MNQVFLSKITKLQKQYGDYMNEHLTPEDIENMAKALIKAHKIQEVKDVKCKAMLSSWQHKQKQCSYSAIKNGLCTRHFKAKAYNPQTTEEEV